MVGDPAVLLLMLLFMPVETLLGQALPVWVLRKLRVRRWFTLCLMSGLFLGLLHTLGGPVVILVTAAAGACLSFSWIVWRHTSWKLAFLGTTAVHTVHNLIALAQFALVGEG